jgi:hypothetical protein
MFQRMSRVLRATVIDDHLLCDAGNLGLIMRNVLDLLILTPERQRFIRGVSARPRPLPATRC